MQQSELDEAAPEATELVRSAEAYVREVAQRSRQSAEQVEPVIQATLTILLEQLSSEGWTRYYQQFRNMLAHDARLWESYTRAGDRRAQFIHDLLLYYLSSGPAPPPSQPGQSERGGGEAKSLSQRQALAAASLPIDLVATIAGTGLVLAEAKALPRTTSEPDSGAAQQLVDLERENVLRVFDGWQELLARSIGGPELAKRLGVSRQRLNTLRRESRLLGLKVPIRRELHYPVWQFGEDGQPLLAMPRLLATAREAELHPRDLDALMVSADAGEGRPLLEHLRAGDEAYVLRVIRAAGE